MQAYHIPVLCQPSVEALQIKPDGTYLDLTFGGGGHSRAILEKLNDKGRLYAFDQDQDAVKNAAEITHKGFRLVQANFRYFKKYLKMDKVSTVDGILADLGISSHQIDQASRGFSTRFDAPLDMRMNNKATLTAAHVVQNYSQEELALVLAKYGQIEHPFRVAKAILAKRANQPIETTFQLIDAIKSFAARGKEFKYYAQVFQALRIEVNQEMQALEEMLLQCPEMLHTGGRLVILSYHSLEDKLVKNFINTGNLEGDLKKDFYGNVIKPLQAVLRKPLTASEEEIQQNNRARSVKMRVAQKI